MSQRFNNRASLLALFFALGCGGANQEHTELPRRPKGALSKDKPGTNVEVQGLRSHVFAKVPGGTMGPYVGSRSEGSMAIWAAHKESGTAWFSQALDPRGQPRGKVHELGAAAGEIGLATVRPVGEAKAGGNLKAKGFVMLYSEKSAAEETINLLAVGPGGELASGPMALTRAADSVLWLSSVPTKRGALALWAVRGSGKAELWAADLSDTSGKQGAVFSKTARAWQAVPFSGGAAVAWIEAGSAAGSNGPVMLAFLDEQGTVKGKPLQVSGTASAQLDLDLTVSANGLVIGWSDSKNLEPRVQLALVDAQGKLLAGPVANLPGAGEQALVDLLAPAQGLGTAYAVWETPGLSSERDRWLEVASLTSDLKPDKRAKLRVVGADTTPELVATNAGIAALTLAENCPEEVESCDDADLLPTFVRLDSKLEVVASEPLKTNELPKGINIAWGLSCPRESCFALAADNQNPAQLFSVELAPTGTAYRAAAEAWTPESPPRLETNQALAISDPLSDVAAVKQGSGSLVAWLTFFDPTTPYTRRTTPAPDGRFDPVRALLKVRSVASDGTPGAVETISYRARSMGGVALSAGDPKGNDALLVWSALDNKVPQVFLTLLGAGGKKTKQQMLTRAPGEVSDVGAGFVPDSALGAGGWIVGWVDERHGDPEVYAARIGKGLQRIGPDRRVTSVTGAATDVRVLPRGDKAWLVWSEARDSAAAGVADIFVATLKSATAEPLPGQRALAKTKGHSHSPAVALAGEKPVVAWLEEGAEAGVRVAVLSDSGASERDPLVIELPDAARPTSLSIECDGQLCHGVVSAARGAASELYGFTVRPPTAVVKVRRLARLEGPSEQTAAPALQGNGLFFADQREGRGFLRLAEVTW
ncbi:MAG: hypothetical protein H6718_22420 [Polyangiaceae bacterium]|nr:hypothetical protein [Myxococcales bacterium]MCB9588180.1 hypothetical protein [Polyangiaceae bacterium]